MACLTGAKISGWVQVERNYWKQFLIDYDRANDKRPHLLPKQRFLLSSSPQSGHKNDKEILKMLLIYLYSNTTFEARKYLTFYFESIILLRAGLKRKVKGF